MAKCKKCRGLGTIFTPRVLDCDECEGSGGEMDFEWAADIVMRYQTILDRAEEEANGDLSAIIGGYNDMHDWAMQLHRAAKFLLHEVRPLKLGPELDALVDDLVDDIGEITRIPTGDAELDEVLGSSLPRGAASKFYGAGEEE
jgi:hypothetical protein